MHINVTNAANPSEIAQVIRKNLINMKTTGSIAVEVKALDDSEYPHGEFVAVLSTPTTDRDMEIVAAKAFDPLPDHITIDVDHALKTSGVCGSGTPYYEGDTLMVKGRFASTPLGQEVRSLVAEGHIRTMSVAFRKAEKDAKDGVTTITKAELLNAAFVAVPANPDALVLSSKAGARNRTISAKTMVGSYEERQEEMVEALQEMYPDAWAVNVVATFDDRVVYEVYGGRDDDNAFEVPYTWDGDDVILGTPVPVEVSQVATPIASGADLETMSLRARAIRLLAHIA